MSDGDDGAEHAGDQAADPVELGVELLSKLEFESLSVADAIDRIETVTTHPRTTREILDAAEERGVIEREDGEVYPRAAPTCRSVRRCSRRRGVLVSALRVGDSDGLLRSAADAGELGAFGSSCIRKVTGRE